MKHLRKIVLALVLSSIWLIPCFGSGNSLADGFEREPSVSEERAITLITPDAWEWPVFYKRTDMRDVVKLYLENGVHLYGLNSQTNLIEEIDMEALHPFKVAEHMVETPCLFYVRAIQFTDHKGNIYQTELPAIQGKTLDKAVECLDSAPGVMYRKCPK